MQLNGLEFHILKSINHQATEEEWLKQRSWKETISPVKIKKKWEEIWNVLWLTSYLYELLSYTMHNFFNQGKNSQQSTVKSSYTPSKTYITDKNDQPEPLPHAIKTNRCKPPLHHWKHNVTNRKKGPITSVACDNILHGKIVLQWNKNKNYLNQLSTWGKSLRQVIVETSRNKSWIARNRTLKRGIILCSKLD